MVPTDERLQADEVPGAHLDDRLVLEEEPLRVERVLQRRAQRAAACHRLFHAPLEDLDEAIAAGLGHIHGRVGVAQHLVRRLGCVPGHPDGSGRDADAGGERRHADGELERLGQCHQDAARDRLGTNAVGVLQQERELVAAQPARGVLGAQDAGEALGDEAQQLVTGGMAERVVDVLEVVEIHEQGRDPAGAVAPDQRVREPIDEQDAVRQAGQRVVQRLVAQLVLEVLPVADVDEDALRHGRPGRPRPWR